MLDINLKDVKKLIVKDNNTMDYSDLIEFGRKITNEKILNLQQNLNFLDNLQCEIERLNSYDNEEEKEFYINDKYYYTIPFYEDEMNDIYYKLLNTLFTDVINKKLSIKNDYGIIMEISDNNANKFVAIEVDKKHKYLPNIIKISEGCFLCKKTNEFHLIKIANLFSHIKLHRKTIIITPSYSYDFSSPYFEVKCSLK